MGMRQNTDMGMMGGVDRGRPGTNQARGPRASPTADSIRMRSDIILGSHLSVLSWRFAALSRFVSLLLLLSYYLNRVSS